MQYDRDSLPEPIQYHPTFDIIDSSKLQRYQECPRGYFFEYVLGWKPKKKSIHLSFGSCWHEAMEYIQQNGHRKPVAVVAHRLFMDLWETFYPEEMFFGEDLNAPNKSPEHALAALMDYVEKYRHEDEEFNVLETEIGAVVPIDVDRVIHGKLDTIRQSTKTHLITSLEHKTSSKNSEPWRNKWNYITQIGTYTHVLNTVFDMDQVDGVMVNGTVFRTRDWEHVRVPVRLDEKHMMLWLWETNHYYSLLEWSMQELTKSSVSVPVMMSFPRNAQSCSHFGCKFPGLCTIPNPLHHCANTPDIYEVEHWDPTKDSLGEDFKTQVDLTKSNEIITVE